MFSNILFDLTRGKSKVEGRRSGDENQALKKSTPNLVDVKVTFEQRITLDAKRMKPGFSWLHEEPMIRLELMTGGLQNRCSTTELHQHLKSA